MKICIASRAPFIAGAEVAGERLALGLMGSGHEVLFVVGTDGEALKRFQSEGIRCHYIPTAYTGDGLGFRYRKHRNALRRLLANERPDIVHSNDLPTHQMVSDAAKPLGIPRVCHHRWIFDGAGTDWFNKFGAEQHVFVSADAMRQIREGSESLHSEPCDVLYDGLEIPTMPSESNQQTAKESLGLSRNHISVLFAGQIVERKGVADILHAWNQLPPNSSSKAELTFVGDDLENSGQYRREMEGLASSLKVAARFEGFQKNVPTWITASDIVLVPSHVEPLGNATLEAMALGRPVIGTNIGGIPEMIEDGKTGLLVPAKQPADLSNAIQRLLQDQETGKQMGLAARRRCENVFSLATHIDNVLATYEQLLEKRLMGTTH
ncbi:glycosyltransferase family 4 protein [Rhodopirellula sp.]|nr:glycosyltransferase family 4 protein [Rhodopirellula sp.]